MRTRRSLHDSDFYAWSLEQAALLRAGRVGEADLAAIAEEIESMGKTEKRELVSRLSVLLLHLLKWQFQSGKRTPSWETSIAVQRIHLVDHLADNPSLKPTVPAAIASAYRIAVLEAASETGLPKSLFPPDCPFGFEQIMDENFWPA
jgi:hypothetical protein